MNEILERGCIKVGNYCLQITVIFILPKEIQHFVQLQYFYHFNYYLTKSDIRVQFCFRANNKISAA